MIFKGLVAATAAVALAATPAIAASNGASSVAPAAETVQGSQLDGDGGSIVVIILALIAAGLGLWVILDGGGDDAPVSP